ncbi:MAG: hypothetical protein D6722_06960 [Bacteroidetes bacterium]|nr:MAG: hypothetical protein D6722_06960 [Bacteroidota bacterium]
MMRKITPPSPHWRLASLFSLLVLALVGCKQDPSLDELIPADGAPAITIISPSSTRFLSQAGQSVTVTFQLADNEALKLFRAVPRIYDAKDSLIGDALPLDFEITGTNVTFPFTLTVPALDPFYKIQYNCYVIDKKGAFATTNFWVSVVPDPSDPPLYRTLTYTGDTIFNPNGNKDYAFNFTSRAKLPTTDGPYSGTTSTQRLQMDIALRTIPIPPSLTQTWEPFLISPNNGELGLDSVFVVVNASVFNYDAADYNTIYRAFFSDPSPATQTPLLYDLDPNDYIIVRLIKAPQPQFAVIRIQQVKDDLQGGVFGNNDQLIFDYKVTTP